MSAGERSREPEDGEEPVSALHAPGRTGSQPPMRGIRKCEAALSVRHPEVRGCRECELAGSTNLPEVRACRKRERAGKKSSSKLSAPTQDAGRCKNRQVAARHDRATPGVAG